MHMFLIQHPCLWSNKMSQNLNMLICSLMIMPMNMPLIQSSELTVWWPSATFSPALKHHDLIPCILKQHNLTTHILMMHILTQHNLMTHILLIHILMAHVLLIHILMARTSDAHILMARTSDAHSALIFWCISARMLWCGFRCSDPFSLSRTWIFKLQYFESLFLGYVWYFQ